MTSTDHKLLGTAARVADLFDDKLPVHDLYGPMGSELYHNFTRWDNAEIDELLQRAENRAGPVLELACGSGRLTLPFLRRGYEVVGLDASPYMMALLKDRMQERETKPDAGRLTLVEGDMQQFSLDRQFGLIILGATAVWNLDSNQRASLFRCVREHLADEGRFLVTVLTFTGLEAATAPIENMTVFTSRAGSAPALCTLFDYVEPTGLRSTSILCQKTAGGVVTDSAMYTTWSYLAPPSALADEITQAGLRVAGQSEITSRQLITRKDTGAGRRRLLFEVAR